MVGWKMLSALQKIDPLFKAKEGSRKSMEGCCSVCCSVFTKCVRKEVSCLYCQYKSCTECTRKYLLDTTKDPHCMNCGVGWNREFLFQCFPKSFLHKELKERREQVLLEREKSMLAASVPHAEEELRKRGLEKEIQRMEREKDALYQEIAVLNEKIYKTRNDMFRGGVKEKEKREFIRACPATGCKGFLSTSWKCGLCGVWVCPECHEIKIGGRDGEHTCDPEILKTVRVLDQETKPCPTCARCIFKISGCDQMWCTGCQTAFSWKTGKIEQGVIHNPHYYEYMRKHGNVPRNIGDVPCGGIPTVWEIQGALKQRKVSSAHAVAVLHVTRCLYHIQQVEIPAHPMQEPGMHANLDLRVRYLLNELNEEEWKKELQKRETRHQKNAAHRLIFDMVIAVGIDLLHRFLGDAQKKDVGDLLREAENLRVHTNESLEEVGRMYKRTVATCITDQWEVTTVPIRKKKPEVEMEKMLA